MRTAEKIRSSLLVLRATIRSVPMMYASAPTDFILLAITSVISGFAPGLWIFLTSCLVDIITSKGVEHLSLMDPLPIAWVISLFVPKIAGPLMQFYQANLAERFTAAINMSLMKKSAEMRGIGHQDGSDYLDSIKILQDGAISRPTNVVSVIFFILRDGITVLSIIATLGAIAWWFPIVLTLGVIPGIAVSIHFRNLTWSTTLSRSQKAREMDYLSRIAIGVPHGIENRVYNYFDWLVRRYAEIADATHAKMRLVRRKSALATLPIELMSMLCVVGLLIWVVSGIRTKAVSVGNIASFIQALLIGNTIVFYLLESISILFERGLFFTLYYRFMAMVDSIENGKSPLPQAPESIQFIDVSFRYPNGHLAVNNVSFTVCKGDRIAIVGENGSGKTTLIKLLLRLYDPTMGKIEVDGVDVRSLDVDSWRSHFSVVQQDVVPYGFTLRENIRLSDTDRSDPDDLALHQALGISGLDAFMPVVNERLGREFDGMELSGGQWQKTSIARAFFRQPDLLVLDEPSSALDPKSEFDLFNRLESLAADKTVLFITHRLGAIRLADKIAVMHHGCLIEFGTHTELLNKNGHYATLWNAQLGQYTIE
ncbi:ABC transporter ATP-binding protein [Verminephrobacter aporrectodeae subsp. tuberculatae]|nr:ABC transporter ATP-binding protein [Verminephrobacter aporrectodeae subsp. tuberculatae]